MSNEAPKSKEAAGAGCLIAASVVICTVIGTVLRQPSIGFLVGATIGVIGAFALWLRDKRR